MTRIIWDNVGDRTYETGVDRGVLYVGDASGVPWSGLISIAESTSGIISRAFYVDGIKVRNKLSGGDYTATLEAYTYPPEFAECDGTVEIKNGLFATRQRRKPFGLCYRTIVGNDVHGLDHGYKIHLAYQLKAEASGFTHKTVNDNAEVENFSWNLTSKPSIVDGIAPTAHFIIDSRETPTGLLSYIEDILYGTELTSPRLPSAGELAYLFNVFENPEYDAGGPLTVSYYTYDGGLVSSNQTTTIDGGTP